MRENEEPFGQGTDRLQCQDVQDEILKRLAEVEKRLEHLILALEYSRLGLKLVEMED